MNGDLISREAAIAEIKRIYCEKCNNYNGVRCRACEFDDAMSVIDDISAVDAEPVRHGRWDAEYEYDDFLYACCSVCGEESKYMYKFCPNCGAKMSGGKETV